MSTVPIAGPRRGRSPQDVERERPTSPPQAPAVDVAPRTTKGAAPGDGPLADAQARSLVPLDYDEMRTTVARAPAASSRISGAPAVPRGSRRVGWFVLGVALGAMGAVWATGETGHTLRTARAWSGDALRALAHKAAVTAPAPLHSANATMSLAPVEISKPCPMDPSADDPCAELLAPFGSPAVKESRPIDVPTVPVEDLPRVRPPIAAATHARGAAASQSAAPTTTAQPKPEPPRGINPNADDSQAGPAKTTPVRLQPVPDVDPAGTAVAPT